MTLVVASRSLLAALASGLAANALADAPSTGALCLAPAPTPNSGQRSLANPEGGLPAITYSIQVDGRAPIELSRVDAKWIGGLALEGRHRVVIRADGKRIESFRFTFADRSSKELCLFMKSLYRTWILWPVADTGDWCPCGARPRGE